MRGPPDSCFENGIYHGRVLLPMEYPLKPPDIIVLTVSLLYLSFFISISILIFLYLAKW